MASICDRNVEKLSFKINKNRGMGLQTLLEAFSLLAYAHAILNEDRFLAPRGWGFQEFPGSKAKSLRGQMGFGVGRPLLVKSLTVLFLLGKMPVPASANLTLFYYNACPMPIFPSLIPTGNSTKINNSTSLSAIDPSNGGNCNLPDGWEGFGFFSTGCTSDGLAARNCTTSYCEGRDCAAEDRPVATTYIISGQGDITMNAEGGYNLGLEIMGMCENCPTASCKAHLKSCPIHLRILNGTGAVVGCKPGRGLRFSESQCTIPGYHSTSTERITCPLFSPPNYLAKLEKSIFQLHP